MIQSQNFINSKKIIIFDLDGVLINSKKNMQYSWTQTCKHFNLNIKFKKYFSKVGLPFFTILKKLNVKKNQNKIFNFYNKTSSKNLKMINLYKGTMPVLDYLRKKKFNLAIVTSKNKRRTYEIIKKNELKFDFISTPFKSIRGKPFPDQLEKTLKKLRIKKKNAVYIGDTEFDYIAAKRAKIKFIFASYGYGIIKAKYKNVIKSITNLKNLY